MKRREFLAMTGQFVAASVATVATQNITFAAEPKPWFKISLAQYSLHRAFFAGEIDNLDFAKMARDDYGVEAVEYVNQFFKDKGRDAKYIGEMKKRADDAGVRSLLIMCDHEGLLGDPDATARKKAVENHYQWVEAAKTLGCHSIRVNPESRGHYDEQMKLAADGLRQLSEFGAQHKLNVLVENHGEMSSNGAWLAGVCRLVDMKNFGTLPDFGNFEDYDPYKGVAELMPFAKAVSAKSNDFDAEGNESHIDFVRMMRIVNDAGYRGYVGVEYEGDVTPEPEGVRLTIKLLEKVRSQFA